MSQASLGSALTRLSNDLRAMDIAYPMIARIRKGQHLDPGRILLLSDLITGYANEVLARVATLRHEAKLEAEEQKGICA